MTHKIKMKKEVDILFVIPPYHKRNGSGSLFPLGIGAIMACLEKHGFSYDYINCPQIIDSFFPEDLKKLEEKLGNLLLQYNPIVVGIGPCVTSGAIGLEIVARCCLEIFGKERVFAGGPFATLPSQEWFFYERLGLSYIIKGDGEEAVCDAIKTIKEGKTLLQSSVVSFPGFSKVNIIQGLDDLPFSKRIDMEKDRLSERRRARNEAMKSAHIVASRGCPYHCTYCVSGNQRIPFRKRSVNNIVEEMKMLSTHYGITDVVFYDDCFFTGINTIHIEVENFCAEIEKSGLHISWQFEIRPDILIELSDDELQRLFSCGCRQMNIGIEKVHNDGASTFGKPYDYIQLKEYLAHVHSVAPIRMTGTFIIGGKEETRDTVMQLIIASSNMNLDDAEYSPLFVYPDTPLYKDIFSDPRSWFDVILSSKEPWGEVVYENSQLNKNEIIALVDDAYNYFYQNKEKTKRIRDRYHLRGEKL